MVSKRQSSNPRNKRGISQILGYNSNAKYRSSSPGTTSFPAADSLEVHERRKFCISSTGHTFTWPDKCYDKIWIGVHGKESVCIVTLRQDVDMTRVSAFYHRYCTNLQTMGSYGQAIASEVECLPYDDKFRERFGGIEKPFGVVSVIPCIVHEGSGNEGSSSAEYDEEKAIDFLRDKMKSSIEFTFDETVQTAISAFQHLWLKELKAEDLWVTTAWTIAGGTKHMRLAERKEHLAMISGGNGHPTTQRPFVPLPPSGIPFGFGMINIGTRLDLAKSLREGTSTSNVFKRLPDGSSPFGKFDPNDSHRTSNSDVSESLPGGSPFDKFACTDYHGPLNLDIYKSLACDGGVGGPTTGPSDVMDRSLVYVAPPEFYKPNFVPPKSIMKWG